MIEQHSLPTPGEIAKSEDLNDRYRRLEGAKKSERTSAIKTIAGGFGLIALSLVIVIALNMGWQSMFRNVIFFIGGVLVVAGGYGLYKARTLTIEDITPDPQALKFEKQAAANKPAYLIILTTCLIGVFVVQFTNLPNSIQAAGLVKSEVWNGQVWRLLTCATLHGSYWHLWMNGSALWGLGRLVRVVSDSAFLSMIFLFSVLSGSLLSLLLLPGSTSVGASGGLMGYTGFLFIVGLRRKDALPKNFFKTILINLIFTAAVGLVGFALIDNAAHFGGLLAGAVCGLIFVNKQEKEIPIKASIAVEIVGAVCMGLSVVISVFSIIKILTA
jgi:membrane associated rhomboid family serine protease